MVIDDYEKKHNKQSLKYRGERGNVAHLNSDCLSRVGLS